VPQNGKSLRTKTVFGTCECDTAQPLVTKKTKDNDGSRVRSTGLSGQHSSAIPACQIPLINPPTPTMRPSPFDDDNERRHAHLLHLLQAHPPSGFQDSDISQIPFRSRGAPPAGTSDPPAAAASSSRGVLKIWTFDEDNVFQSPSSNDLGMSPAVSGTSLPTAGPRRGKRRKWRWPWQEEPRPTGDRIVALNDETRNADYLSNAVSMSKYNLLTFVPKFFTGVSHPFHGFTSPFCFPRKICFNFI
jgi:hypothetical protein